jgi:hypothetical protein
MKRLALLVALLAGCTSVEIPDDWVTTKRDDLVLGVELTGTLIAVDKDSITPPQLDGVWNFKIAFMAPEGSEIAAGQPCLGFDSSELSNLKEQKENERDAAAKELEQRLAEAKMARQDEQLQLAEAKGKERKAKLASDVPEDLTALIDLQKAKLDLELAQTEISFLEKKIESSIKARQAGLAVLKDMRDRSNQRVVEIEEQIAKMTIPSPREGTVIYESRGGEKKKAGDSVWRSERVLSVVALDEMNARGTVDEVDMAKVAVGQVVRLRLDAHPDLEITGKVSVIGNSVHQSRDNPEKVITVTVALDKSDPETMRPSMRFRGMVETDRKPNTLVAPVDAVFVSASGAVAYRKTSSGYEAVAVTLGARNEELIEITGGLEPGDEISRTDLAAYERKRR